MHLLFFEYDKAPALYGAGALPYLQADPNAGAFDRLFRNRNDKYTSLPRRNLRYDTHIPHLQS